MTPYTEIYLPSRDNITYFDYTLNGVELKQGVVEVLYNNSARSTKGRRIKDMSLAVIYLIEQEEMRNPDFRFVDFKIHPQ